MIERAAIRCFSGTGNSLWAARELASRLGGAPVLPVHRPATGPVPGADVLGLVFPVHIWGVPRPVVEFVERLDPAGIGYCFAVAVNGGQVARTLLQLGELLERRGIRLAAGFGLTLPSNYIPWGGPGSPEKLARLFDKAAIRIGEIAAVVGRRETRRIERGRLWENVLLSLLYRWSYPHVPTMDRKFLADERCTRCGICRRICPAGNIRLEDGRPVWLGRCWQCMACIQWCPPTAIQYGPRTVRYQRYHHPSVTLKDLVDFNGPT